MYRSDPKKAARAVSAPRRAIPEGSRDAIAVLCAARKLLAKKGAWVPGYPMRRPQQCLATAMSDAAEELESYPFPACTLAAETLLACLDADLPPHWQTTLPLWNDRQKSVKPVLTLIDRTIRRLEKGSENATEPR